MSEATGEYLRPVTDGDWQALIDMKDSILRLARAENDQLRAEVERLIEITTNDGIEIGSYEKRTGLRGEIKLAYAELDALEKERDRLRELLGRAYPIMFDLCDGEVLDEKLARRVDDFYRAVDALEGGDE